MEKYYVFGDESGTPSKNDGISHFIYACVLIKESELQKAREVRNYISQQFLDGHIIKASNRAISKNLSKRIKILKYLCENLDFHIYSLVIDKKALFSKGLDIKTSFIKFFQRILLNDLAGKVSSFQVFIDSTGNDDFQISLKNYIVANIPQFQANLFNQENSYHLKSDEEEELIQLADLVSNSLMMIYSESKRNANWEELFNTLESKLFQPLVFPYNSILNQEEAEENFKVSKSIYSSVLETIERFKEGNIDKIKSVIVNHLVYISRIFPTRLIETYELKDEIKRVLNLDVSLENIRINIRDLRYKGVLIISKAGKSGYKIAVNEQDISSYFQHYLSYIIPMLEKANIADEALKISMDSTNYNKIHKFIKALKEPDILES
ncbi:DUF3800 domain-containing protein [Chryseobacterium sp. WG14]|uniref:DUF3800 domain-containing protein n=1 Tax=Chryseobacterium sp. WG14 TaxID=2926909 RepID=UPI00211EA2A0|nr:DUF3800 domain-containing protein [Chryseobacterium sp. WG14]MCQ9639764.1 DUF3800 domain-containing protein [Chryseobacterium sp. WG14]